MRSVSAFFIPAIRPAVLVLLLLVLASFSLTLMVVNDPEFPTQAVDVGVLAILFYAGGVGFLAGASLRELKHARFSWVLPGIRGKTCLGFVLAAFVVSALVAAVVRVQRADLSYVTLLVLGVAAFCLGSVLSDPLSRLRTTVHTVLALLLVVGSEHLGELCASRPPWVVAGSVVLAGLCLQRGFGVTAFRETPFRPVSPIPGAYSLGQSKRYELEKMARRRPVLKASWRLSSIAGLKSWLRRAYWENARGFSWKTTLSPFRVVGPLAAVMAIHVLFAEQGLGFRSSLALMLYHSILRPPHIPPPADAIAMPYLIIPLFVAAIGATLAITRPAPLGARLLYPLSRTQRGRVVFRANLLETTSFILTTGGGFLALALIAAAYGNHPLRIDYVPSLLRALVVAAALIPVFQWMRLRVLQRESRRSPGAAVLYTFALLLAVLAVAIWCTEFQLLALPALAELLILGLLLVASQGIYRHRIERYFRVGDLN